MIFEPGQVPREITAPGTYLFQRGMRYPMSYRLVVRSPGVVLDATGNGPSPVLDGMGTVDLGIQGTDVPDVTVKDLEFTNYNRVAIYHGHTAGTGDIDCRWKIQGCHFHDLLGGPLACAIQMFGRGVEISDVRIRNVRCDGVWIQGDDALIEDSSISDVSCWGDGGGDCVQITGKNARLINSTLDHQLNSDKQVVAFNGGGLIDGCVILARKMMGAGAVTVMAGNCDVMRNIVKSNSIGVNFLPGASGYVDDNEFSGMPKDSAVVGGRLGWNGWHECRAQA